MAYWVRCRKCLARRTLAKHPDEYIRLPPCKSCGSKTYRVVKNYKRPLCTCSGYHFIHRKGSYLCEHHPQGYANRIRDKRGVTKDEVIDAILECPGKTSDDCPF